MCIYSHRYGDTVLFYHLGGVDIGDVDAKAIKLEVAVDGTLTKEDIIAKLLVHVPQQKKE